MNFLFGSGLSRPYLSTLGEIETWLTDLNTRPGLNDVERDTPIRDKIAISCM